MVQAALPDEAVASTVIGINQIEWSGNSECACFATNTVRRIANHDSLPPNPVCQCRRGWRSLWSSAVGTMRRQSGCGSVLNGQCADETRLPSKQCLRHCPMRLWMPGVLSFGVLRIRDSVTGSSWLVNTGDLLSLQCVWWVASCNLFLSKRITSNAGWVAEAMILCFQCETCSTCPVFIIELHQGIVIFFTMRTFMNQNARRTS